MPAMIRRAPRDRYTVIPNNAIEDSTLSFKALGLLTYLLSKPDHWKADRDQLAASHEDGVASVRSGLRELAAAGYLVTEQIRGEGGRLVGREAVIYDTPQPHRMAGNRMADNPPGGKSTPRVKTEREATTERSAMAATADAAAGQLPGLADPHAGDKPGDDYADRLAWQLVREAYASRDRKPIESRKTTKRTVVRLLAAGWSSDQIGQALTASPAWTPTSLQVELHRGGRKPAGRARTNAVDRTGESAVLDMRQVMNRER